MSRKSEARQLALQLLFLFDANNGVNHDDVLRITHESSAHVDVRVLAGEMAERAWEYHREADAWLERIAPQWPPKRQGSVDRNILRLGLWEMTHADTPKKVVVDEAIEMAKTFGAEDSPRFVNGVLDAAMKEIGGITNV